ncbi:MAG: hypothetical protein AMXMBFR78_36090 [Rubrivivax sp.]
MGAAAAAAPAATGGTSIGASVNGGTDMSDMGESFASGPRAVHAHVLAMLGRPGSRQRAEKPAADRPIPALGAPALQPRICAGRKETICGKT